MMMTPARLTISLLATSIVSFAAPAPSKNSPHKLSLPARTGFQLEDGKINAPKLFHAINATLIKYNSDIVLPPLKTEKLDAFAGFADYNASFQQRPQRRADVELDNDNDMLYTAPVSIGSTNPQEFSMDFDTGSSDIVVPGPTCNAAAGCKRPARYPNLGTKVQQDVVYSYGGGKVRGDEYTDVVTVANLTVQAQGLMSVAHAPFFSTGASNYDGLFGMAFTGASGSSATTFMENLIRQKSLPASEFSFYLGRSFKGTSGADSTLTLGGRDPSKYTGSILKIPVVNQTAWVVALEDVTVGAKSAGRDTAAGIAAIDTGTSFIVVPTRALAPIFALVPGAVAIPITASTGSNNLIMYAYPCDTPASSMPVFHLNGTSNSAPFAIDPADFTLGAVDGNFATSLAGAQGVSAEEIEGRGLCLSSLLGVKDNVNPDLFVLGTPFLKGWYSVFSYGEEAEKERPWVGFAKSVAK